MNLTQASAFLQAVWKSLQTFWRSLPHQVQAGAVAFASAAATYAGTALFSAGSCWTMVSLKHGLGASLGAGAAAVRAFYMRPGPGPHAGETPAPLGTN